MAVLAGLRPKVSSFDWASMAYALTNLGASLVALYTGWRAFATMRRIGALILAVLVISVGTTSILVVVFALLIVVL